MSRPLRACRACSRPISAQAEACPHCGHPVRAAVAARALPGVLTLALVGVAAWSIFWRDDPPAPAPAPAPEAECAPGQPCWPTRHQSAAMLACKPHIEARAKNQARWPHGYPEPVYAEALDDPAGGVVYLGDDVQFQNGFGAWTWYIYACHYDPTTRRAIRLEMAEGRI